MNKTIFICDDNCAIVDMLEMALTEFTDATIITETDSRNVVPCLLDAQPEIFLVDISMPMLSGDQLIKEIKRNLVLNSMFIVCMSANPRREEIAIAAGADVFLVKPFDT